MYKETAVSLVSKAELAYLKDDDGFVKYIINQLSQSLSDKLLTILDKENEVICRESEVRISDYKPTDSVEYRRQIEWCPLVRCKDCKWRDENTCLIHGAIWKDNDFCSQGERKDDEFYN